MTLPILFFPIFTSFIVTLLLLPIWIRRARKAGIVGKDQNKHDNPEIPESGGVTVLSGFALGTLIYVAIITFILKSTENLIEIFALLSSIFLIAFIAFTDDILGWKIGLRRRTRMIMVLFSAIPLIAINAGKSVIGVPFLGAIDIGIIYPLFLIPLGMVGATTTFNFLAGYNGLEAGQGIIILFAFAITAYLTGNGWLAVIALCMAASLAAFLIFNIYPAKVFPGDSLTYPVGGLMAIMAILGNFERIAVFFFIPYIIETLLKSKGGLTKQSYANPTEEGFLNLRYKKIYSLSHLAILFLKKLGIKSTEKRVVYLIWGFQIIIILLGFLIFRNSLW